MKKTWQAPQLVILTRSKPEEAILTVCKTSGGASGSPVVQAGHCDAPELCWQCNGPSAS